jgi:hypothetical protein
VHVSRAFLSDEHPPSPEQLRAFHRRTGPPDNEVPGAIEFRAILARNDDLAVAIVALDAYSTGLSISFALRLRHADRSEYGVSDDLFGHHRRGGRGSGLLVGIAYPDGRTASNVATTPFPDPLTPEEQPYLMQGGGSGGDRTFNIEYWLTPIPPPGDLTIIVAWQSQGIPETHTSIPADLIAVAVARTIELWPWQMPEKNDQVQMPTRPPLPEGGWFAEHVPDDPPNQGSTS